MNKLKIGLIGLVALSLVACTQSQVISSLEATLDAAIAADSIVRPQDAPYLAEISDCLNLAIGELATTATPAIKASTIALGCAKALSDGNGAPIQLQAVVAALNAFLSNVESTKTAIVFSHPEFANSFAGGKVTKVSKSDLKKLQKKLDKLKRKLHKK